MIKSMLVRLPGGRAFLDRPRFPHGERGIRRAGHRRYIGGMWEEIGRLQFDFLVSRGLRPPHYLLDVACGSLRGGVHFIPYLDHGRYLGIDKEEALIRAGVEHELDPELVREKAPELIVSDRFEFERFAARPDFGLAQSLFTHLPPALIDDCFRKLRAVIRENGQFFATYFESRVEAANPEQPHDHGCFQYTQAEMEGFGARNGWSAHYIGDWNHPRTQVMVRYTPA